MRYLDLHNERQHHNLPLPLTPADWEEAAADRIRRITPPEWDRINQFTRRLTEGAMKQMTGYDANGIRRVWGEGPTLDIAETRCKDAALDYVQRRRDTGPLSAWTFRAT